MKKLSEMSDAINEQLKTEKQIEKLVAQLAKYCITEINKEVIPNNPAPEKEFGKGSVTYARQYALEELIKLLDKSV